MHRGCPASTVLVTHAFPLVCQDAGEEDSQFAIVFAAMGVNMETAHFFKQVGQTQNCETLQAT